MIVHNGVPGRRGWDFGEVVTSPSQSRCAVSHVESGHTFWAFGFGAEERLQAAHTEIDRIYQLRWDLLSDLIEEGDRRGPNVKLLDVPPTA